MQVSGIEAGNLMKDLTQEKRFKCICYHTVLGAGEDTLIQQFLTIFVSS